MPFPLPPIPLDHRVAILLYDSDGAGVTLISGALPVSLIAGGAIIGAVTLSEYTPVAGRLPVDGSGVTQSVSAINFDIRDLVAAQDAVNVGQWFGATTPTVGQKTMAASLPVAVASDQGAVPVSGTITANPATSDGKTITYVPVNQGGAGTTELAAASAANKHKVVGAVLVLSALGTVKFTDGVGDLTGPMDIAANAGFVLPSSNFPYTETAAINRVLNLVTTLGAARGVVAVLTEA